ncbi:hypothetical protein VTL71DRAFT_11436 [Oculimacula yallundae]|uniref:Uncharacterized protein n=1 Tax=Oculimacula yallundae TaxID=86028 RepID=A0ABR4CQ11_9HELO
MSCRIGLSWLLITTVSGLQWFGPQETVSATATADWTPAPTGTAEDSAHKLFNRQALGAYPANLLGWQGPRHGGAYCGDDSYVAYVTDIEVVGCCKSEGSCDAVYTSCIDTKDPPPKGATVLGVMTCSSLCYQNTYQNGYHQYGCGSYSIGEQVVTSYAGSNPQLSVVFVVTAGILEERKEDFTINTATSESQKTSTIEIELFATSEAISDSSSESTRRVTEATSRSLTIVTEDSPSSSLAVGASTTRNGGTTLSAPTTSKSATSTPVVDGPNVGPKGLSTGAKIAIGVVAAVIAIIAIALLAFCIYRRQKKNKKTKHFLSTSTDGGNPPVAQYDQPIMGTRKNPTELFHDQPIQSKEAQFQHLPASPSPQYGRETGHTNSLAPSYELDPAHTPIQQMSPQSTISSPTFRSNSPHPSSLSPGPTMPQYSHMYELPTGRAVRVTELDGSQASRPGMHASYGGV